MTDSFQQRLIGNQEQHQKEHLSYCPAAYKQIPVSKQDSVTKRSRDWLT